jgi:hypothetical protein
MQCAKCESHIARSCLYYSGWASQDEESDRHTLLTKTNKTTNETTNETTNNIQNIKMKINTIILVQAFALAAGQRTSSYDWMYVDELVESLDIVDSKSSACSGQVIEVKGIVDEVKKPLDKVTEIRKFTKPIKSKYETFKEHRLPKLQDVVKYVPKVGKVIKTAIEVIKKVGDTVTKIDDKLEVFETKTAQAKRRLEETSKILDDVSKHMADTSAAAYWTSEFVSLAKTCSIETTTEEDNDSLSEFAQSQLSGVQLVERASTECVEHLSEILGLVPDLDILVRLLDIVKKIAKPFYDIIVTLEEVADAVGGVFDGIMKNLCCVSPELTSVLDAVTQIIDLTTCLKDAAIHELVSVLADIFDIEIHIQEFKVAYSLPLINFDQYVINFDQYGVDPEECTITVPKLPTVNYEPYDFVLIPGLDLSIKDALPSATCNLDFDFGGSCGTACCTDDDCPSRDRPICDNNILSNPTFTCVPKQANGEPCTYSSTCESGICMAGIQCVECVDDSDCAGKSGRPICDTNIFSGTQTCIPKKQIGESCTYDSTCASGNCYKPTLTGAAGTCQCNECSTNGCGGCPLNQQCKNPNPFESNYCYVPKRVGERCSSNDECGNDACGRASAANGTPTTCCASGSVSMYAGYDYCTRMSEGATCWSDAQCASGYCKGNYSGFVKGRCFRRRGEGESCPSKRNADCAGSAGCYRTTRRGNYKCCSRQKFCDLWDKGCTTGYWYCKSSGLG